jgi:hypothetical protein
MFQFASGNHCEKRDQHKGSKAKESFGLDWICKGFAGTSQWLPDCHSVMAIFRANQFAAI